MFIRRGQGAFGLLEVEAKFILPAFYLYEGIGKFALAIRIVEAFVIMQGDRFSAGVEGGLPSEGDVAQGRRSVLHVEVVAGGFRCGDGLAEPRETLPNVTGTQFANPYIVRRGYAQLVLCPLLVGVPLELVLRIERDVSVAFPGENPMLVLCDFIEGISWEIGV